MFNKSKHSGMIPLLKAMRVCASGATWFQMTSTEDAAMFNRDALEDFDVVVFMNTTGDVLNDRQQSAFNLGTNRGCFLGCSCRFGHRARLGLVWPVVGRVSVSSCRPAARLIVMDRGHPATAHLDSTWVRTDEWYDFKSDGPLGAATACSVLMRTPTPEGRPVLGTRWHGPTSSMAAGASTALRHQSDVLGAGV